MINKNWIFGIRAGLEFSGSVPVATSGAAIQTNEGCASVSDENGQLLFYTDGRNVWDAGHQVRVTNLQGHASSTQSSIIVPAPGQPDHYYIFTADGYSGSNHHLGGVLLETAGWTSQSITSQFPSPAGFSPTEKVTALQSPDCQSVFVFYVLQDSRNIGQWQARGVIRVVQIDANNVTHVGDFKLEDKVDDVGYLRISPDGKWIGFANWAMHNVLIFPLDSATGIVDVAGRKEYLVSSVPMSMDDDTVNPHDRCVYGLEFSPEGPLFYFSVISMMGSSSGNKGRGYIYQGNLDDGSQTLVATSESTSRAYTLGALQLGPDGRIYVARPGTRKVGAILEPALAGVACQIDQSFVGLAEGTNIGMGLPNLLANPCSGGSGSGSGDCGCGCKGCNESADDQNEELQERAKGKFNHQSAEKETKPFPDGSCELNAIREDFAARLNFSFHWGDSKRDEFESHDTEIFYLTVCNPYKDVRFNGLRITKIQLVSHEHSLQSLQIVPDRFVNLDCLSPCACQTREFALITRSAETAGEYELEVEYCYESISFEEGGGEGKASFPLEVVLD